MRALEIPTVSTTEIIWHFINLTGTRVKKPVSKMLCSQTINGFPLKDVLKTMIHMLEH